MTEITAVKIAYGAIISERLPDKFVFDALRPYALLAYTLCPEFFAAPPSLGK